MILLDAYAVLAYLTDEAAAPMVAELLEGGDELALATPNLAEVLDHLVRRLGADPDEAVLDLAELGLTIVILDVVTGRHAGLLRARHYHRERRAVSLADCMAAAVAINDPTIERLATADPHLLDLLHEEQAEVLVLPDSTGDVWTPRDPGHSAHRTAVRCAGPRHGSALTCTSVDTQPTVSLAEG